MQTRFLKSLSTTINPFSRLSKTPRLFLSLLPPNARSSIQINVKQLTRATPEPSTLNLTFKDGKEMKFVFKDIDAAAKEAGEEKIRISDILEEVERHCRTLARKEELTG